MDNEMVSKTELLVLKQKIERLRKLILQHQYSNEQIQKSNAKIFEVKAKLETCQSEKEHWKARYEYAWQERNATNKKVVDLQFEIESLCHQVNEITDYSCQQGVTLSKMLWELCSNCDVVNLLLTGSKFDRFLNLMSISLNNYIQMYKQSLSNVREDSKTWDFAISLVGIFTNVAAFPVGRQYIMSSDVGKSTLNILLSFLSEMPPKNVSKLKNIILSAIQNVTINSLGLQSVSSFPNILTTIVWHLQEEIIPENRVNCLLLLEALLVEQTNESLHLAADELNLNELLQHLSKNTSHVVREHAINLLQGLELAKKEA